MSISSRYWRRGAAALAAGAMALSVVSPALAQQENQAPAPADDEATTALDTAINIDVLANDADPDDDSIHITEWTQGTSGAVEVVDAIVTYTPSAGFSGEDTFQYTVSDGELETTATVTVTVGEVVENQAPEPMDDTAETAVDTAVEIDVLANDADPDGDSIHITEWTQGTSGAVEVVDAIVTYHPNAGFSGEDTFQYTVSDGELETTATVTVTVGEVAVEGPEAVADSATTTAGTGVEIDVLANDTAPEGVEITIEGVTAPANGTAEVVEGVVVYTPAEGFEGEDTFDYTITDGENTSTATVTVTVEAGVNPNLDPAVVEACESYTGDDLTILHLCRVYMTGELSPFVQQIFGSIILFTIPPVVVDPVIEACEANAGTPLIDALCGIYQNENVPEHVKEQVGRWVLELTSGEEPAAE